MTLQTQLGSQSGAQMIAPAYARSVFQGNVACFNGNGQPPRSISGHGFSDISRGSTYIANLACQNWATGFIDNMSAFITHNGDKAISNNRGGGVGAGISDWFGLDNSYIGVTTDDNTPGNLQNLGVGFSRSTNGYLESSSLCNYSTCNSASLVADSGTNDVILIGKNFPSQAMRVSGCATPASVGASCTVTVTWHTPYADTNYTATCTGDLVTSGVPVDGGITAKSPSSITFRTVAATAAAAQFTSVDCMAKHD